MGDLAQLRPALRHQPLGLLQPQLGSVVQSAFAIFLFEQVVEIFGAELGSLRQLL
ncbi:hypothetical protein D3C79_1017520 [compost metagenome]